ncbi:MAG: PD-(D/E)XK nuclease domain-containing protein [Deltaproteobacteria bacterium]|nr:PD-(D/E)XK nuclease domain-containing protein [Deltaproteobacteria bacterium]
MKRFFNTTGPCDLRKHYMLPALARLPGVEALVDREQYFVVHAARQTGKTTAISALAADLRARGTVAVFATLEESQGIDDLGMAESIWLRALRAASIVLPEGQRPPAPTGSAIGTQLNDLLMAWAAHLAPVRLAVFLDEADVVRGAVLVSLLRQLRAGFPARPDHFPASVALVGMRDLRDYLAEAKDGAALNPGSPFNIKAESITLQNFTGLEIATLYAQHTADTGQAFSPEAVDEAHRLTRGQPFLVNALAGICVDKLVPDRSRPVERAHVTEARERLILSRTTHLDSLGQRLREPRVARVIAPILEGTGAVDASSDDFTYCIDLGLVAPRARPPEIANPIYREVIARELSLVVQDNLRLPDRAWKRADGSLDATVLVDNFLGWWREHSEFGERNTPEHYREAFVHLCFMAYLQRVVNGGGQVHREYAAGTGRVDLCVEMGGGRAVFELKRVRASGDQPERVLRDGVEQLCTYLDRLGEREGWLVVFDQRPGRTWDQRLWAEERQVDGRLLHLRGA